MRIFAVVSAGFERELRFTRSELCCRMDSAADLYRQALEICRKHGSGSDEYAEFLAKVRHGGALMPHGVTMPRYVPGDIRNKRKSKKKGRGPSNGRESMVAAAAVQKSAGKHAGSSTWSSRKCASFSERGEVGGGGLVRTVSETLMIEGLQPVVITRQQSVGKEVEDSSGFAGGAEQQEQQQQQGEDGPNWQSVRDERRANPRAASMSVVPDTWMGVIDEEQEMRDVVDQFKVVLHEKARVEGSLCEAHKTNEALKKEFESLEKLHVEMKSEQEMMHDQVAMQLQHLLKEKSMLMEQNQQLQSENNNLKVLLDLATAESESDVEYMDEYLDKSQWEVEDVQLQSVHGICAWHPAKSPGGSSSGDVCSITDVNDMDPGTVGSVPVNMGSVAVST